MVRIAESIQQPDDFVLVEAEKNLLMALEAGTGIRDCTLVAFPQPGWAPHMGEEHTVWSHGADSIEEAYGARIPTWDISPEVVPDEVDPRDSTL